MLQYKAIQYSPKKVINPSINLTQTLSKNENVGYPIIIQAMERSIGKQLLKPLVIETYIANLNVQVDLDTGQATKQGVLRFNVIMQKKHNLEAIFLFLRASSMVNPPPITLKWKL